MLKHTLPWPLLLILMAATQIALALWVDRQIDQRVEHLLAARPPLRVLDVGAALQDGSPHQLGAALKARQRHAERLAAHGILVLDRGSGRVLAAPPALITRIETLEGRRDGR